MQTVTSGAMPRADGQQHSRSGTLCPGLSGSAGRLSSEAFVPRPHRVQDRCWRVRRTSDGKYPYVVLELLQSGIVTGVNLQIASSSNFEGAAVKLSTQLNESGPDCFCDSDVSTGWVICSFALRKASFVTVTFAADSGEVAELTVAQGTWD